MTTSIQLHLQLLDEEGIVILLFSLLVGYINHFSFVHFDLLLWCDFPDIAQTGIEMRFLLLRRVIVGK